MLQHALNMTVLHMNAFNSAINQPFYSSFSTLQLQFIVTTNFNALFVRLCVSSLSFLTRQFNRSY